MLVIKESHVLINLGQKQSWHQLKKNKNNLGKNDQK